MRNEIDIEAMVRMAYGQFRVHRLTPQKILGAGIPPSPGSGAGGMLQFMMLGTRVDTSMKVSAPMGEFMRAGAKEQDDLLDLHDAVLALPDVYLEGVGTDRLEIWTAETMAEAGAEIVAYSGDQRSISIRHADGREARVEEIVTTWLVVMHGERGDRPDWCEGGSRAYPVYREGQSGPKHPVQIKCTYGKACLIEFRPLLATVLYHRAQYSVWHWALQRLVATMPELSLYRPTGPRAPEAPWDESRVVHKAIA